MWLRRLPLTRKLTAIILIASFAALLAASAVLAVYDAVTSRRGLVEDLALVANVVGINSTAALAFNDRGAAGEVLSALAADRHLVEGVVLDAAGEPFARYVRDGAVAPVLASPAAAGFPDARGHRFADDALVLYRPIELDGERLGAVGLRSDLDRLDARRRGFAGGVALALLVALLLTLALSARLQRVVSEPILDLVDNARRVSQHKDYSLRAEPTSDDELGLLVGAFNEMLERIESRDRALRRSLERLQAARARLVERSDELERVNLELARSNRELEDFAFVASHDLQEPLRKITAFGERLESRDGERLSDEGRDYVERMRGAAVRMKALIDDLLAYSRVTTRGRAFEPVDLGRLADEVLADLELRIETSGARVERSELPVVEADPRQMQQLFQNLLSNALKFQRPDVAPEISVRAEVITLGQPIAPGEGSGELRPGPHCRLEVADNGIGFDEKYLERLFKPFHRLHGRTAYEGTGIGLAICKKIVERHRGSITARSEPGRGATFEVLLPLEQTTATPQERGETASGGRSR